MRGVVLAVAVVTWAGCGVSDGSVNALGDDEVHIEGPAILDLPDTTVAVRPDGLPERLGFSPMANFSPSGAS